MNTTVLQPDQEEELHLFSREHWMVFLNVFFLYGIGLLLGAVLFWLGNGFYAQSSVLGLSLLFTAFFVVLVVHHWLFMMVVSSELSGWVITNKRIIEFNFLPYVRHDMSYLSIHEVGAIVKQQHGLTKNFLHYGEVEINIATSQQTIKYHFVPYPGRFVDLVSRLEKEA